MGGSSALPARSTYDDEHTGWRIVVGDSGGKVLASGKAPFGGAAGLTLGRTPDTVLIDYPTPEGAAYEEAPLGAPPAPVKDSEVIADPISDPVTGLWIGNVLRDDVPETVILDPCTDARVPGGAQGIPGPVRAAGVVDH